jgi:hypothetical protein
VTRLSDRADPVPDDVWAEAARHYDEPARGLDHRDRNDQRMEPPRRHHPTGGGLGPALSEARLEADR